MKKIDGVESVEVRLNEEKAVIKMKPGNGMRFDQLVKIVRDKAFTPKEARIIARGELVSSASKLQLQLTGTSDLYELTSIGAEAKENAGKAVLVEGIIPAPKGNSYDKVIQVKSVRPLA